MNVACEDRDIAEGQKLGVSEVDAGTGTEVHVKGVVVGRGGVVVGSSVMSSVVLSDDFLEELVLEELGGLSTGSSISHSHVDIVHFIISEVRRNRSAKGFFEVGGRCLGLGGQAGEVGLSDAAKLCLGINVSRENNLGVVAAVSAGNMLLDVLLAERSDVVSVSVKGLSHHMIVEQSGEQKFDGLSILVLGNLKTVAESNRLFSLENSRRDLRVQNVFTQKVERFGSLGRSSLHVESEIFAVGSQGNLTSQSRDLSLGGSLALKGEFPKKVGGTRRLEGLVARASLHVDGNQGVVDSVLLGEDLGSIGQDLQFVSREEFQLGGDLSSR